MGQKNGSGELAMMISGHGLGLIANAESTSIWLRCRESVANLAGRSSVSYPH
jgi:hypothetical protein